MGLREVKSELNKLDKANLIRHISDLYKKFKPVKEYLDFQFNRNENEILSQYKEKVTGGFFPKRGCQPKFSVSRKALNDFKKIGCSQENYADLLLHYVECGVEFTVTYGDIDEQFYTTIENAYGKALDLMDKVSVLDKFYDRASKVLSDTDGMGWGFHDCLGDIYCEYYE